MSQTTHQKLESLPKVTASQSVFVQIFAAMLLGATLIYGVGFASMDLAHNAAHDARHSVAFPCH
ncbi:MAG: hypothetical protein GKR96_12025 [Gammaproteobacteria bacterium]|nr:hypothetical protein [Gammaproteobacteria bacterium]